jgi:uncharacterized RDD family membrane protein YckC
LTAKAAPSSRGRPPDAGLARRLAALSYEALLVVALLFVASFALVPFVSPDAARTHALAVPSLAGRIVSFVALFALGALFFGWSWSSGRRTLPMKTWRMALVDANDAPLSRRTALVRYVAAWIGPALATAVYALAAPHGLGAIAWPMLALNWIAAFVDPDRKFLHDRIAGTRLITS